VLRIILAGQPELNEKLDAPELVQLTQRVRLRFHLTALSDIEMRAYIQHRLEVAGAGDREIFAESTYLELFRYTGGVPRLINTLCDTAMMAAFAANRDHVTLQDVVNSVEELQWDEFPLRAQLSMRPTTDSHSSTSHLPEGAHANHAQASTKFTPSHSSASDDASQQLKLARLLVATEGRTVQEIPLQPGRIIVGRTPDNDLQIDSRFISRHHCHIIITAHSCVIEDLNSTNGIYVQSKRVRRHYLNDGDVVVIGKHELMYLDDRVPRVKGSFTSTIPSTQAREEQDAEEETP